MVVFRSYVCIRRTPVLVSVVMGLPYMENFIRETMVDQGCKCVCVVLPSFFVGGYGIPPQLKMENGQWTGDVLRGCIVLQSFLSAVMGLYKWTMNLGCTLLMRRTPVFSSSVVIRFLGR